MTEGSLAHIYRHPVKGLGGEALGEVDLAKGKPLPYDRRWAVAHGDADSVMGWAPCKNFVVQRHTARLAQLSATFTPRNHWLKLSHPDLPDLGIQIGTPDGDDALSEWIEPLTAGTVQAGPFLVYELTGGGAYTDIEDAHISIGSEASRRALSELAGTDLQHERFRMALWIDGFPPYAELDWVGQEIEIGDVRLKITERDERCNATTANPRTGKRDVQVPALLKQEFGHMDFGVFAQVVKTGTVRTGDPVRLV